MRQFFEGVDHLLSMSRLCMFGAWAGSTISLLWITYHGTPPEWIFNGYCATWGGAYVGSKITDKQPKEKPNEP